jgi:hypothetical protein
MSEGVVAALITTAGAVLAAFILRWPARRRFEALSSIKPADPNPPTASEQRNPTMSVTNVDVGPVVKICAEHCQRVRYGVLGAALNVRAGNPDARPGYLGNATASMVKAYFRGMYPPEGQGPLASWVVGENGQPSGYGDPLNPLYDPKWSIQTPLYCDDEDVEKFLAWLDKASPGWDHSLPRLRR